MRFLRLRNFYFFYLIFLISCGDFDSNLEFSENEEEKLSKEPSMSNEEEVAEEEVAEEEVAEEEVAEEEVETQSSQNQQQQTSNTNMKNQNPTVESINSSGGNQIFTSDSSIVIKFSKKMAANSVTSSITDSSCAGSIQISYDNFATCIGCSK